MTITEFLLARIDEDEKVARQVRPIEYLTTRDRSTLMGGEERGYGFVQAKSGRVLAECEAKRRLVEQWGQFETYNGDDLLCVLAAVYADHPDYRPEWRP